MRRGFSNCTFAAKAFCYHPFVIALNHSNFLPLYGNIITYSKLFHNSIFMCYVEYHMFNFGVSIKIFTSFSLRFLLLHTLYVIISFTFMIKIWWASIIVAPIHLIITINISFDTITSDRHLPYVVLVNCYLSQFFLKFLSFFSVVFNLFSTCYDLIIITVWSIFITS